MRETLSARVHARLTYTHTCLWYVRAPRVWGHDMHTAFMHSVHARVSASLPLPLPRAVRLCGAIRFRRLGGSAA